MASVLPKGGHAWFSYVAVYRTRKLEVGWAKWLYHPTGDTETALRPIQRSLTGPSGQTASARAWCRRLGCHLQKDWSHWRAGRCRFSTTGMRPEIKSQHKKSPRPTHMVVTSILTTPTSLVREKCDFANVIKLLDSSLSLETWEKWFSIELIRFSDKIQELHQVHCLRN